MMKTEKTTNAKGKEITVLHDDDGKICGVQYGKERLGNACIADFIISEKTMTKLKEMLKQEGASLTADKEWGLYCDFNDCLNYFKMGFGYFGLIENQKALSALIKAFKALGPDGQQTLIEIFYKKANLSHIRTPDAADFSAAAKSLLTEARTRGRKSSYADQTRRMLFEMGYVLFLDLELEPTIANGGVFGQFMKAILNDPATKPLGRPPENIKKLISAAKKTVESSQNEPCFSEDINSPF